MRILELREKGLSQSEIADKMGTTRSNISAIEKNARRNIKKSENTLEIAEMLKFPVTFEIEGEGDIHDLPRKIYERGDEEDIKIKLSSPELLEKLREKADSALEDKEVVGKVKIGISREGGISIVAEAPQNGNP